ncbi:hypothetical protein [Streptomyces sp. NBC_01216]|uniref:hypothetical protein n=1 Tax=unclassified Streptomyces TaxID=2593676 RepID=UPI002E0E3675|nr:hypothetical protein OG393_26105 [Streptomyces sp. NBC_01216]
MRALHHRSAALASAAVLFTGIAVAAEVRAAPTPTEDVPTASAPGEHPEDFGASCRTVVQGSRVTAYCHNPYPDTDRVRLHVECARWWDVDTDSAPADVDPTAYVQVTGRCWKEVRTAWVTHQPAGPAPSSPDL